MNTLPHWWQNGVIYQIYPKSFQDTTGSGTGDLRGVTARLDYLKTLGIDAIWLTPFYISPQVDNGYDVANYIAIDPAYGTLDDFDELVAGAHQRGIRIVLDMVFNHTSTQHAWFRESLNKESPYRQFYIWRDGTPEQLPNNWRSKFGGNAWRWHAESEQYYLHLFAPEQADLNWENPAVRGYKAPRRIAGRPSVVAPNLVQRQFTVVRATQVWVTDITYIRTWQGWLYLAVVIDLFARNVVGWSMKPTLSRELALDALMMAVWRRKPDSEVIVHSDQGSQYGSDDWQRFYRANNLAPSMSRRGNCWDNAVAESFFSSLKKERIRKRIYKTRDLARADIFDYIEVFYNRARRHSHLGGLSPEAFEQASS